MSKELPQLYMFPCNFILLMKREKSKEIKGELFREGKVPVLVRSPEVWEHLWAHVPPLGAPPSGECTHMGTSLTTKKIHKGNTTIFFIFLIRVVCI
jgi:hypothetical protein